MCVEVIEADWSEFDIRHALDTWAARLREIIAGKTPDEAEARWYRCITVDGRGDRPDVAR